jgi:hypothetical protein
MIRRPQSRFRALPDSPYAPGVTDVSRPLRPPSAKGSGGAALDGFVNRNISGTTNFSLVAGVTIRALPRNPRRVGLQIQNIDTTSILRYSLGNDLQGSGLYVGSLGTVLYDFTTPPDELYLFSVTNLQCIILEISRGFSIETNPGS